MPAFDGKGCDSGSSKRMNSINALVLCAILIHPIRVSAETKVWTGLSTTLPPKWEDADNWKPSIPGERDDVVIGEPPYSFRPVIQVKGPIKLKSLYVNRTT